MALSEYAFKSEADLTKRWKDERELPAVSIICLTYNHSEYIEKALSGFLLQETTFPFEIIIHDDASTDGTADIIRKYSKKYPNVIKGVFQNENQYSRGKRMLPIALPHARGRYIALCDGDDYWADPNKLQIQYDFLEKNDSYVVCYHDAYIVDEVGRKIKESKLPERMRRDFSGREIQRLDAWILVLTMMFRNILDFPREFHMQQNGDVFYASLLGWHGHGKYLPQIKPSVYRKHPDSAWSSMSRENKNFNHIKTLFWLHKYYERLGDINLSQHFKYKAFNIFIDSFEPLPVISLARLIRLKYPTLYSRYKRIKSLFEN